MDQADLIALVTKEVKGISVYLVSDDYSNACDDAMRELGWAFPIATNFKILWAKQRVKRHLFFYLMTGNAGKFKVDQINLNQRFDNYKSLVRMMDADYQAALKQFSSEFAGVDPYQMFGVKIDAGFSYDEDTGRDTTYEAINIVQSFPNESDE